VRSVLLLCLLASCRCTHPEGEVDGQKFARCAQASAPTERSYRVGSLTIAVQERVLTVTAPHTLSLAAFSGPVGAALRPAELSLLAQSKAQLSLYLGGLGDDEAIAKENLRAVAKLGVPTLFVAGGGDRLPIIEAAFAALSAAERDYVIHASGLRELRIGRDRLIIVAGAPLGRYALDADGCGFTSGDLDEIQKAASVGSNVRTWLVSWHAPAGFGVSEGLEGVEIGSPDLRALALALHARGGIAGYPDAQAGQAQHDAGWRVVPRLARTGALRADGSRLPASLARLVLDEHGLYELR
jgi:hypothetical protein